MTWKATTLLTVAALLLTAGAYYVVAEPPYPGIFDSNLNKLAETAAEANCSGQAFGSTRGGGDPSAVKKCLETSPHSTVRDHSQVVTQFCDGLNSTAGFPRHECRSIIEDRRMWPTLSGTVTGAFNDKYPYPGDRFLGKPAPVDNSRTGERDGLVR
jgi:hypothetical protein